MKHGILIACFLCATGAAQAQLNIDFSANDYPATPIWRGHTFAFGLQNDSLLRSQTLNSTYLSTPNTLALSAVWEFEVQLDFNPSAANMLRVYLVSDTDTLTNPLDGYFIQIGETGNTDRYHLYKQNGTQAQLLLSSSPKQRANPAQVRDRVRIVRDSVGAWEMFTAIDTMGVFTSEGAVVDAEHTTTSYFGIQCLFTPSNSDKFGFRYFVVDTTSVMVSVPPPAFAAKTVTPVNDTTLRVVFNRQVDTLSGENVLNYTLDHGYGHPASAHVVDSVVALAYSSSLISGSYVLSVDNVTDTAGVPVGAGTAMAFDYTAPPLPDTKLVPDDTTGATFFDDFSDGIGGHWLGELSSLKLVDERLKLDTSATSPASIHTASDRVRNTVWEAGIDINGSLSTSNYIRLYLATADDLAEAHQGYHLQIDGSSGNHTYRLWRQNGASRSSLFQSMPIPNQHGKFRARVRVVCDINGEWQILADEYDSGAFEVLTNADGDSLVTDQTYNTSAYLGYRVNFTTTRREDFKLDYMLVRQYEDIVEEPDPLAVNSVTVLNDTTLRVVFNRQVDTLSGENVLNYTLDHGYGHPASAHVVDSVVALAYSPSLIPGSYVLSVDNVTDTAGVAVGAGTAMAFDYTAPPLPDTKLVPDDTAGIYFYDDFKDGIGGHWLGELSSLKLVDERLKLDTSATSPASIHTASDRVRNTVWEAGIDINGSLSTSNYIRLYLVTSNDPAEAHQGYHLQIDGSSGNHTYRLWRQNGGTRSSLFQSMPVPNQHGKFRARVRVVCDINGEWRILADEYDSGTFEVLTNADGDSTAIDQTYNTSAYLGYRVNFTTTRREDFKLDYMLVRKYEDIVEEPDPLAVNSVTVLNDTTLRVVFNRQVDTLSGENVLNYTLDHGYGHPASAHVVDSVVALAYSPSLIPGSYVLSVDNVTDTAGVAVGAGTAMAFDYTAPPLPDTKLVPDDTAGIYFYDDFKDGIGGHWLGELSSLKLVDERLKLDTSATSPASTHTASDRVRNTVWEAGLDINGSLSTNNYIRLYLGTSNDPAEAHQGYHLQIDGSSGNHTYRLWRQNGASRSSIFRSAPIPNQHGKFRARVRVVCDINGEWQILADEYDSGTFEVLTNADGDSTATDQTYNTSAYLGYRVNFTTTRREDFKLDYVLVRPYEDIATPPEIFAGEILINEILSNPKPDGVDFVELYNHSEKTFDLQMLYLANVNSSEQIAAHRQVASRYTLFYPYTYIVLTTAPDVVKQHYPNAVDHAFVPMASLPAFPNAEGGAVILSDDRVIDSLRYTASMHSNFIVDPKGVSLEREAFHLPTNAIGNFRSASTVVGGATPGYQNSRVSPYEQQENESVYLSSRTFSPDNDGFEDVLEINYLFDNSGMMANVEIYNDQGVLVRRLVRNQSLATEGVIEWDGTGDGGRTMPIGIYVVVIEVYHAEGIRRQYRKSCVLAGKF